MVWRKFDMGRWRGSVEKYRNRIGIIFCGFMQKNLDFLSDKAIFGMIKY